MSTVLFSCLLSSGSLNLTCQTRWRAGRASLRPKTIKPQSMKGISTSFWILFFPKLIPDFAGSMLLGRHLWELDEWMSEGSVSRFFFRPPFRNGMPLSPRSLSRLPFILELMLLSDL